jgi:hypothetical protein
MAVALTDQEKERIRYHLGYNNVDPITTIALGFPATTQSLFLVDASMERLQPATVSRVLFILGVLDQIEGQMIDALKRLRAQQLGELKLRGNNDEPVEQDLLEREYYRWAKRLSDNLGAPLNAYSTRFREGGGDPVNISVAVM